MNTFETFAGNTEQGQEIAKAEQAVNSPFLPASWWEKGAEIKFEVLSKGKSFSGHYLGVRMISPEVLVVDNRECAFLRITELAGIYLARKAALDKASNNFLAVGDVVTLSCTGFTAPKQAGHFASPNFSMLVQRPKAKTEAAPGVSEKRGLAKKGAARNGEEVPF